MHKYTEDVREGRGVHDIKWGGIVVHKLLSSLEECRKNSWTFWTKFGTTWHEKTPRRARRWAVRAGRGRLRPPDGLPDCSDEFPRHQQAPKRRSCSSGRAGAARSAGKGCKISSHDQSLMNSEGMISSHLSSRKGRSTEHYNVWTT